MERTNWRIKILREMVKRNVYWGTFIVPMIRGKQLFISDISLGGNAWGKILIDGRTWKNVYNKLMVTDTSNEKMSKLKWLEWNK